MTTTADLIHEVRKIASEQPNFVYDSDACSYFGRAIGDPTGQCCIIGQAFKNLEVYTAGIKERPNGVTTAYSIIVCGDVPVEEVRQETLWLDYVQQRQDQKIPWATAVKQADTVFKL